MQPDPRVARIRTRGFLAIVAIGVVLVIGAAAVLVAAVTGTNQAPRDLAGEPGATDGASTGPGPGGVSGGPTRTPTGPPVPGPTANRGCPPDQVRGPGGCFAGPPVAAGSGKAWKVSFSEEFNGSTYDKRKLTPCFDWNYGACTNTFNHGREHYDPGQIVVSGGSAKLIAEPLSSPYANHACQNESCTYKAGLLSTARPRADNGSDYLYAFTYGYVEARIKFPATRGFFTAFWMLPTNRDYEYRTEIDILELLGDDPTTMFMTYHYDDRESSFHVNQGRFNNGACPVKNYAKGFVRMGLDWQPNRIAWYIDGVRCAQFTRAADIENGPMQLILHMMVDNDWQREWSVGLADPTLVRQLEVDYIRVYQRTAA
jgi:hypothetical protein